MKFNNPAILFYMTWLVGAVVIFYLWAVRDRVDTMKKFAEAGLLDRITLFYDRRAYLLKIVFNITAAIMIVLALARPQWGFYWEENNPKGIDMVIALDVSKSMLAADVLPNRLECAKAEIADFVKKLKNDRVGLIAFAGNAFLQCPLTVHYNGFMLALQDVNVGIIEKGGTAIASAIDEAINSYRAALTADKILIIVTDGENTEGDLKAAVGRAKKDGVKIFCIGIGSKEGATISVREEGSDGVYPKDSPGTLVQSRLDEGTLREIAVSTGGSYIHSTEENFGLEEIYSKYLSNLDKREFKGSMVKMYNERFQIPLALAACLLLAGLFLGRKYDEKI